MTEKMDELDLGLSVEARQLAVFLNESSKSAQVQDPLFTEKSVQEEFGWSHDQAEIAIDELMERHWIDRLKGTRLRAFPTPKLFLDTDRIIQGRSPEKDAHLLASALLNASPKTGSSTDMDVLAKRLQWKPRRTNVAAYYLDSRRWAEGVKVSGTGEYAFKRIRVTARTKRFVRDARIGQPEGKEAKSTTSRRFHSWSNAYTVTGQLGEGGVGRVYKVVDESSQVFALKTLQPDKLTSNVLQRFKNELGFCRSSQSKHIIRVIDDGFWEYRGRKIPFYVMPYYGETLGHLIQRLDAREVLPYFSQILDGVEAAHLGGIFHRDLKPENILHDPDTNTLVVADFGIAHFSEEELRTAVKTRDRDRLANFKYAAPEQKKAKSTEVDHRADIYSLGLLLNEMFTTEIPEGTKHRTIGDVAPEFAYLDDLVDDMRSHSPKDRPSSVDALKLLLIAKQNDFIHRQRVSELRGRVVPTSEIDDPLVVDPPRLAGLDYREDLLVLRLSKNVTERWINEFRAIGNYSGFLEREPASFKFKGKEAAIPAMHNDHENQQLINYFKEYLEKANAAYREKLEAEQSRKEASEKERIRSEINAEEERERKLRKLKI